MDRKNHADMTAFEALTDVVERLMAPDGCPWDRAQTHQTLKAPCIEEAAEVICGINILEETGKADNLREELGDLLLQVLMHAKIAEKEGLFTLDDVCRCLTDKLVRRHPHVFGDQKAADPDAALASWEEVKRQEKKGKDEAAPYLPRAFDEAEQLIDRARKRKGLAAGTAL